MTVSYAKRQEFIDWLRVQLSLVEDDVEEFDLLPWLIANEERARGPEDKSIFKRKRKA
jgi:hypothetical protein